MPVPFNVELLIITILFLALRQADLLCTAGLNSP
jgi:hypothetical protein